MRTIVFDIETNGLLDTMDKIHCIAAEVLETRESLVSHTREGMKDILDKIADADRIVAHNGIGFDVPAIKMIYPDWEPKGFVFDTLVAARALWPDVNLKDYGRTKAGYFPARLIGSHSLEAYGYRLGVLKGEYGKKGNAWEKWSQEMEDYCIQDVVVLRELYKKMIAVGIDERCVNLEMGFATLIQKQMDNGVYFDTKAAVELMSTLIKRRDELLGELQVAFPPRYVSPDLGKVTVPRGKSKLLPGSGKGQEYCKIKLEEFNPNSRPQIADRLIQKYGWQPDQTTEKGAVQINETVLESLDYPETKLLAEYMMITKRLGMLSDGNNAWLKLVKNDRIYGRVNTGGAVSGRCTHNSPNLAQVPAVYSPYGKESRSLFRATPGMVLVGCDASGLELRCLGHYLARYDHGAYAKIILEGDIHTSNQIAAGLPERNMAKTFIYGWLYGAGSEKLGSIVHGGFKEGERLKKKFFEAYPQIKMLMDDVQKAVKERGYLVGLDGRKMRTRSDHSALNLLLQGAGALVMKRFTIEYHEGAIAAGLIPGVDFQQVLSIHDEAQIECKPECVETLTKVILEAFLKAGQFFNFRCPIEGEVKVGETWAQTH